MTCSTLGVPARTFRSVRSVDITLRATLAICNSRTLPAPQIRAICWAGKAAGVGLRPRSQTTVIHATSGRLALRQAARALGGAGGARRAASTLAASNGHQPWDGTGSQEDLLLRDQCILVDGADIITGSASKRDAHRFDAAQPGGLLHRAFSVFLFDASDRLLLQQRAPGKVTFPRVWTNTCCSHPLHGQAPPEVDAPQDIASAAVPGVKHAAVRKLRHELGIAAEQLPLSDFRFLTRLHYCAVDPSHAGKAEQWGEHEVDHILFIRAAVDVASNPEEVADHRYVTREELRRMMDPDSGLAWSPWFRIIADKFLDAWWAELDAALNSDKFVDTETVHRLDTGAAVQAAKAEAFS